MYRTYDLKTQLSEWRLASLLQWVERSRSELLKTNLTDEFRKDLAAGPGGITLLSGCDCKSNF